MKKIRIKNYIFKGSKGMDIYIDFMLILIIPTLFFIGQIKEFMLVYICTVIHELAHILTAKILKVKAEEITFMPVGISAVIQDCWKAGIRNEIFIYLSGPLSNILLSLTGLIFIYIYPTTNAFFTQFIQINIFLAIFNLIPLIPLDGSKIMTSILSCRIGVLKSALLTVKLSSILIYFLLFISLLIFFIQLNYLILLLWIYIFGFAVNNRTDIIGEAFFIILHKRYSFKKNKSKCIFVSKETSIIDIIKEIDRSRILKVLIKVKEPSTYKLLVESEIIKSFFDLKSYQKIGELIKK